MVRIHPDPPLFGRVMGANKTRDRGCSSAGRAPALQAGGHRFDPGQLHQRLRTQEGTRERSGASLSSGFFGSWRSPAPARGGHIGSLKIREVEGGVLEGAFPLLFWDCRPQGHPGLCIASCTPYLKGWSAQRALTRIPCSSRISPVREIAEL
jgi:hypothetical protein